MPEQDTDSTVAEGSAVTEGTQPTDGGVIQSDPSLETPAQGTEGAGAIQADANAPTGPNWEEAPEQYRTDYKKFQGEFTRTSQQLKQLQTALLK